MSELIENQSVTLSQRLKRSFSHYSSLSFSQKTSVAVFLLLLVSLPLATLAALTQVNYRSQAYLPPTPTIPPRVTPPPAFGLAANLVQNSQGLVNYSASFNPQTFTVEAWSRWTGSSYLGNQFIVRKNSTSSNFYNDTFSIFISNPSTSLSELVARVMTSSGVLVISTTNSLSDGKWHHLALLNQEGPNLQTTSFYVDGQLKGSQKHLTPLIYGSGPLLLGLDNPTSTAKSFIGQIDEVRISSSARYLANFSRPTQPFIPDQTTIALYHLDGEGKDSSSNKFDLLPLFNLSFVPSTIPSVTKPSLTPIPTIACKLGLTNPYYKTVDDGVCQKVNACGKSSCSPYPPSRN